MKRWLSGLLAALTLLALVSCAAPRETPPEDGASASALLDGSAPEDNVYIPAAPGEDAEDPPEGFEGAGAYTGMASPDTPETTETGKQGNAPEDNSGGEETIPENGSYTTKEDVALYIHTYGRLPDNFITKKEAQNLGWSGGSLEPYAPGMCIGGNRFGNYEGLLPEADNRSYTECDIDTLGAGSRGAKRIVFSNDGLVYYTEDHYASFELLYGEE